MESPCIDQRARWRPVPGSKAPTQRERSTGENWWCKQYGPGLIIGVTTAPYRHKRTRILIHIAVVQQKPPYASPKRVCANKEPTFAPGRIAAIPFGDTKHEPKLPQAVTSERPYGSHPSLVGVQCCHANGVPMSLVPVQ